MDILPYIDLDSCSKLTCLEPQEFVRTTFATALGDRSVVCRDDRIITGIVNNIAYTVRPGWRMTKPVIRSVKFTRYHV